jgi:hypothetical protein
MDNDNDNIEIVVARYNENLIWTKEYPFNRFKYTVYNKGVNDDFEKSNIKKIINLPNVGRCDHTYLYHVVHNYSNLVPITVFFPGSIGENQDKKEKGCKILLNILKYKTAIFLCTHSDNIKHQFKNFTLDKWCCTDKTNAELNSESDLLPAIIRPYGRWYDYHFGNIVVKNWCIHGIFSIHKLDITQHNIRRYIKLLNAVARHSNPEVGHYIERSWCAIFHPLVYTKVI